jgi:hypothetical protein
MASELAKYSKGLDGPFELLFDVFTDALLERRKFYGDEIQEILRCYFDQEDHHENMPQVWSPVRA